MKQTGRKWLIWMTLGLLASLTIGVHAASAQDVREQPGKNGGAQASTAALQPKNQVEKNVDSQPAAMKTNTGNQEAAAQRNKQNEKATWEQEPETLPPEQPAPETLKEEDKPQPEVPKEVEENQPEPVVPLDPANLPQIVEPEKEAEPEPLAEKVEAKPGRSILRLSSSQYTFQGEEMTMTKAPYSRDGVTFAPAEVLAKVLGGGEGSYSWDPNTQTLILKIGNITLELTLDSKQAFLNGEKIELSSAPEYSDHELALPVRDIAEIFGYQVTWDETSHSLILDPPDLDD